MPRLTPGQGCSPVGIYPFSRRFGAIKREDLFKALEKDIFTDDIRARQGKDQQSLGQAGSEG